MGKPAARIGDMTAHGGTIIIGHPTVLIGGMPAARLGDMHVCPMMTPAGPAPIPHVGMPIILGSAGVFIGGMPAARMGDMATCTGPPDSIVMGCPTVLIGEVGGGSGGGGGGGGGAPASVAAQTSAITALMDNNESTTKEEHWVEIQFVDKAGNPVSGVNYKFTDPENKESEGILRLDGTIRRDATKEGQAQVVLMGISNAKWSKDKAEVGEKVKMSVDVEGFENGTKATVQIFKRDIREPDVIVESKVVEVKSNKIETEWEYQITDSETEDVDALSHYSHATYYFVAQIGDCSSRSNLLGLDDSIDINATDENGDPLANESYRVFLSTGEIREGSLDSNGHAKLEDVPPGRWSVVFPDIDLIYEEYEDV
ncbi:MAG: PAAR domain-containing protein [bacterium]|nr:MAG: PAAR domain-containing protein [bacterium]